MTSIDSTADSPHPHRWLVLLAMTGSLSMIMLDVTVVAVALPSLSASLGMGPAGEHWVMNAYTLTIASLVALGGRLADSIGRVRCFVAGMLLFTAASVVCGIAHEPGLFLAGRVFQGIGAALMQPSSSTIVISSFAPGERGKAMGVYVGIPMLFLTLGPMVGGLLTDLWSWRACFFLNIPIALFALVMTFIAKPDAGPRTPMRIDPAGATLYLLGLPAFVFGVQQGVEWGWRTPAVLVPLCAGFALVVAFVLTEWHRERPLLNVRLFQDRGFLGNACVLFCAQFAMTGQVIFMSQYFQSELGYDARRAGTALLPMLLPTLLVVHVAGRMYDKVGARRPVLIGTALAAIGLAIQAFTVPSRSYLPIALGMVIFGIGMGFTMSPTNTDALSRVGPQRRGQASGLLGTLRQVAGSLGIAMIGGAVVLGGIGSGRTLADGAAVGHWVACIAFSLAFFAAFSLLTSGAPARNGTR